jgi:signal transduction histidine kinase
LAGGIAHEISTPLQYIGDNVHFLRTAFTDLLTLIDVYERVASSTLDDEAASSVRAAEEAADLAYVRERAPGSFERTLEGVARAADIVAAVKAFADPGDTLVATDLNDEIETTLTVARNEYKYVAEVEKALGPIPSVTCCARDIREVVLTLLLQAASAVEAASAADGGALGRITVETRQEGDSVVLTVSDTGAGAPPPRLDGARATVVERHGGALTVDARAGSGTTVTVRLPIQGPSEQPPRRHVVVAGSGPGVDSNGGIENGG